MGCRPSKEPPYCTATEEEKRRAVKRACLVGVNFPDPADEYGRQHSCVNDVFLWKELLMGSFGFEEENIKILIDEGEGGHALPNGKIIKDTLRTMAESCNPGDIIFVSFSGHGTVIPADEDGEFLPHEGFDRFLIPGDVNLLVDDDFRDVFSFLNEVVKITMVADCSHSTGFMDHDVIEILEEGRPEDHPKTWMEKIRDVAPDEIMPAMGMIKDGVELRDRTLKYSPCAGMLIHRASFWRPIDVLSMRIALFDVHLQDSCNAALAACQRQTTPYERRNVNYIGPGLKPKDYPYDPDKGYLISGSTVDGRCYEVKGPDGTFIGALTFTIAQVVKHHKRKNGNRPLACYDLVQKVRQVMKKCDLDQEPCLECSEDCVYDNFIDW